MNRLERETEAYRAWLEERRTAICSTDSPKILGLSRWGSPRSVYYDKVDPLPEVLPESSLSAWLGRSLEDTVARRFTHETGLSVRRSNRFYRLRDMHWIGGHIDFFISNKRAILECKTRGDRRGWGGDESDVIPPDVWVQVQHEMLITGTKWATVACLFGLRTFGIFYVNRDDEFLRMLKDRMATFWHEHVLAGAPPDPIYSDAALLADQYPQDDGVIRSATPATDELILRYRDAQKRRIEAEKEEDTAKARIKDIIGTASGITGLHGTVTWKADRPNALIQHDEYAAELELMALELGVEPEKINTIKESHTYTRDPQRVFLFKEG